MDVNLPTAPPTIQPKSLLYNNKFILFLLFILLETIYTFILLNISKIKQQNPVVQPTFSPSLQKTTTEDKLPIGISLLENPIVYQWSGSVEGKLISKNENSITLKDDKGNSILIPLRVSGKDVAPSNMTFFIDLSSPSAKVQEPTPISKVPLGSTLRGNFFVIPGNKDKIVGGSFTIIRKGS